MQGCGCCSFAEARQLSVRVTCSLGKSGAGQISTPPITTTSILSRRRGCRMVGVEICVGRLADVATKTAGSWISPPSEVSSADTRSAVWCGVGDANYHGAPPIIVHHSSMGEHVLLASKSNAPFAQQRENTTHACIIFPFIPPPHPLYRYSPTYQNKTTRP